MVERFSLIFPKGLLGFKGWSRRWWNRLKRKKNQKGKCHRELIAVIGEQRKISKTGGGPLAAAFSRGEEKFSFLGFSLSFQNYKMNPPLY